MIMVEPKNEADRTDDKLLYRASMKVDKNNIIREAQIEMDSLCHYERSLLGLTYEIIKSKIVLSFKEVNGLNSLAFVRVNFVMRFTSKKISQTEDFVSEFVTLDVVPGTKTLAKGELYKKSALYKHDNKYETPFWNGINIPALTMEEEKLISELETRTKTKGASK